MSSKSSTTESRTSDSILVGLIHKPHGLGGEVAVQALSDVEDRFAVGSVLDLAVPGVARRSVRVRSSRPHGRSLLVAFDGVVDREGAELLRGGRLEIDRSLVPPAPDGEYYHVDLVGCRCFAADGSELGVVGRVLEDGGGEILGIDDGHGQELLVPFVHSYLERVDVAARRIDLNLPEGLIETCRSKS